jgi:hypothetical protein
VPRVRRVSPASLQAIYRHRQKGLCFLSSSNASSCVRLLLLAAATTFRAGDEVKAGARLLRSAADHHNCGTLLLPTYERVADGLLKFR